MQRLVVDILAALYAIWSLLAAMVSALVIGTTMLLPFIVVPRGRRERFTIVGAQLWARFVVWGVLLTRVRVRGSLGGVDGCLLLCNHRSWLDPLLLIGWGRSNGLSKKLVWYIPAVGIFGWLSGAVYFDRRSKEQRAAARADVMNLVRGGHRIQLFPEGTRSKDGTLREKVYLTLVKDCWSEGIPVVPCAVSGTQDSLPVGRFAALPLQEAFLSFGTALQPGDFADADSFASAAWEGVKQLHAALPP